MKQSRYRLINCSLGQLTGITGNIPDVFGAFGVAPLRLCR